MFRVESEQFAMRANEIYVAFCEGSKGKYIFVAVFLHRFLLFGIPFIINTAVPPSFFLFSFQTDLVTSFTDSICQKAEILGENITKEGKMTK